jgi:osmotically-inducible protein OsmY
MIDWQRGWLKIQRPAAAAALCGVVVLSLQGCAEIVIGSAVMSTMAATDRRTLGAQTEDKAIVVKGESVASRAAGERGHVNVSSYNRKVLLTGEVPDEQVKAAVAREVGAVEGVLGMINELEIAGPSNYTARSNDTYITGKVKASFVDAKDLFANSFKVVTERGNVYLMGRVTQREGNRAAEVARGVSGVQKVVKVLEYISEDELKQMSLAPAASAK